MCWKIEIVKEKTLQRQHQENTILPIQRRIPNLKRILHLRFSDLAIGIS